MKPKFPTEFKLYYFVQREKSSLEKGYLLKKEITEEEFYKIMNFLRSFRKFEKIKPHCDHCGKLMPVSKLHWILFEHMETEIYYSLTLCEDCLKTLKIMMENNLVGK